MKNPESRANSKLFVTSIVLGLVLMLLILIGDLGKIQEAFFKKPAVVVINIDGEIITTNVFGIFEKRGQNRTNGISSTNIVRMLEYFSEDDSIKAIILEINSFGGQTAGKEEIVRYIKRMNKPVIAVITDKALSSGYFVAAGTDKIYARKSSEIGELANFFVYVNRNRNGQEQICHITSSNYKTITLEECNGFDPIIFKKLRSQVGGTHELLVSYLSEMRGISESLVESLTDKTITSDEALKLNLVDEIGTTQDAVTWLEEELNTTLWIVYLRDMLPNQI